MSARRIPRQRRSASGLFWSGKNDGIHIPRSASMRLAELEEVLELAGSRTALAGTLVTSNGPK
jgi:hypothetical protein